MKRNYYKLNLNGSCFWQSEDCVYTQKEFSNSDELLNTIYFRKISNNEYEEILTKEKIVIDPNNQNKLLYPKGVIIDVNKLTPADSEELIIRFDQIKKHNLNKSYMKVLIEFLRISHYCELAKEKKDNDQEMKRTFKFN